MAGGMWDWVSDTFWPRIKVYLAAVANVCVCIWGAFKVFIAMSDWAADQMATNLNSIDFSTLENPSVAMLRYYYFIDRFIPLHEVIFMTTIYFHLWISLTAFRWIKQFVPTLSN